MSENTPTPAAAAAPAVLSDREITEIRRDHSNTHPKCPECRWLVTLDAAVAQRDAASAERDDMDNEFQSLAMRVADYDERLDAARADLAEFARQTREAQASLLAAIKDKETERQAREQVEAILREAISKVESKKRLAEELAAERNRRRWAETRASHWRRQEDLVMIRLAQRSNELGRANLAHRTALAQERQAREQAERDVEILTAFHDQDHAKVAELEAALADSLARGERLEKTLEGHVLLVDTDGYCICHICHANASSCERVQHHESCVLAAPASPAAEPGE